MHEETRDMIAHDARREQALEGLEEDIKGDILYQLLDGGIEPDRLARKIWQLFEVNLTIYDQFLEHFQEEIEEVWLTR